MDLVKHVLLVLAGAIVFLWTLYLMVTPLKFALGLTLFVITFVAGELLLFENRTTNAGSNVKLSSLANHISVELVVLLAFTSSLVIILLVPADSGEIFVGWAALELPIAARLIASFGLNFFPGYFVLSIVGVQKLGRLPKLISSYLVSFFLLSTTGFICAYVRGILDGLFFNAFSSLCVAIIAVYLLRRFLKWRRVHRSENPEMLASPSSGSGNRLPFLLVSLVVIFMGIWLWWMYSRIGFFIGAPGFDSWRIHGNAQTLLDYRAFAWLQDPWWFDFYIAGFIYMSGASSVNAYMALSPLIVLPVLAFHVMASSFFRDNKMASIATLCYAIFSGPVWFYALYLRGFSAVPNYDDWTRIIFQAGEKFLIQGWYPPFLVSFTQQTVAYAFLWFMVYASWRLDLRGKFNFFLLSIAVALSYLIHGVDPIIFAIYLFAFLFLCLSTQDTEGKKRVRLSALSILVAVLAVGLIDLTLTSQYDYFNSLYGTWVTTRTAVGTRFAARWYFLNSPSFFLLILASVALVALTYGSFAEKKVMLLNRFGASVKKILAEVIIWLYGASLIVFVALFPYITLRETVWGGIPGYVYLVIGGVPFFLAVVGMAFVLLRWNEVEVRIRKTVVFCTLSLALLFVFGQVVSFVNEKFFYTGFWERRVLAYVFPIMSLPMAYTLVTLFNHVRVKAPFGMKQFAKVGLASLLISLIVFTSASSTLVSGDLAQHAFFGSSVTWEELEALRYLHYSLPAGSKIGYLTLDTGRYYIRGFANDKWNPDQNLFLMRSSPWSVLSAIRQGDVGYLYVNRNRDSRYIEQNLFIQQLIKLLPVKFNNSEVTIYSIPPLQYPSSMSALRLVSSKEESGPEYDAYVLWSLALMMSEHPYMMISNVTNPIDVNGAENIVMPYDPPSEKDAQQLLEWVSNGGHLILSDTNLYGMFSRIVGLVSKFSLANADSTENWRTVYVPKRGEILVENTTRIEGNASLRLKNDKPSWEEWLYTPSTPWNLSGYEYLGIWVYGTGGGYKWYLYMADSNGNENYFRYDLSVFDYQTGAFVPNFLGWKLHLIPIRQYYGGLNLSVVKELRIVTGWEEPVDILIDDIFALEESERSIVSANGIQGAATIDLPTIEIQGLSPSADVGVIANYTRDGVSVAPFAIQKDLGSGRVTYLNANLLYQSILSGGGFASPYEVLVRILEMTGVEKPPS